MEYVSKNEMNIKQDLFLSQVLYIYRLFIRIIIFLAVCKKEPRIFYFRLVVNIKKQAYSCIRFNINN